MEKDTKEKIVVYGTNFLTPSFIKLINNLNRGRGDLEKISDVANPFGAVIFGALDIAGALSAKIKNSKFTRLTQFVGASYYGVSSIMDVFSIAGGEYKFFANLAFDSSMAYCLIKDTVNNYRGKKDLLDDLTKW